MKLLIALIFPVFLSAQKDSLVSQYTGVKDSMNAGSSELFSRAKSTINKIFVSYKDVTQLVDEFDKRISVKGIIPVSVKAFGPSVQANVWCEIIIETKENRYRYSIGNFKLEYSSIKGLYHDLLGDKPINITKKQWADIKLQVAESCSVIINAIATNMALKNDW